MTHTEAATMQLSSEGAVGVPLKFVLVRGRRVVEQRRTRLLCPSLEDVKGCVRQWACGVFTLRYVDDEGDLVTVDLDEEWAECVALWREARGADDADVCAQQRALRLVVTIGAQDGSAVCLGQQRHPRQAFWERRDAQRDGHRHHHHQHMHGRHGAMPGIRQLLAEGHAQTWRQGQEQKQQAGDEVEPGSGSVTDGTPCCRRSVKHAGEHGPRCRVHGRKSADATDVPQPAVAEVCCAGEGCSYAVTRRHGTHCCHMCARGGGQHGPRCEQRHMETSDVEAAAPAVVGEDVSESVKKGMPCCRRSVKHAGEHGPHCRVHKRKNADATDVLVEQTEEETPAEAVSEEVKPCCRRNVKHTGQHGTHCRVHGKKSGDDDTDKAAQTGATAQTPEEVEALQSVQEGTPCCRRSVKHAGKHGPHCRVHKRKSDATEAVEVPSQEEEEEEDVTAGVPDAALLVCAGCIFELTGVHATHCCVRCAKHAGQHGPRCEQKMPMAAEDNEDDEDVVVVAVQAEAEREEEAAAVCEEDSAGVTALRNMGFDITAHMRAVLERHNGDVAAVLEEMM